MPFKKISTKNTSIAAVNAENLAYADKTQYIEDLEADPDLKVSVFFEA
ncbi:MAG: hypothetical protein SPL30_01630 [Succinivibrio sp.]|nr:hypothetical protein [Succinivibrio sp.]